MAFKETKHLKQNLVELFPHLGSFVSPSYSGSDGEAVNCTYVYRPLLPNRKSAKSQMFYIDQSANCQSVNFTANSANAFTIYRKYVNTFYWIHFCFIKYFSLA